MRSKQTERTCAAPDCTSILPWSMPHQPEDTGLCQEHLREFCVEHNIEFTHYQGRPVPNPFRPIAKGKV